MGEWSKDIIIYRNDNYECLTTIENSHSKYIVDFFKIKNNLILSFSGDNTMKIWFWIYNIKKFIYIFMS